MSILSLFSLFVSAAALSAVSRASVVSFTLPIPYRTSLEQPMAGPPAVYSPPNLDAKSAFPFDFNGDGTPEFITGWNTSGDGIFMYPVGANNQVITTTFSEVGVNPYPFPLPAGALIGADPPGDTVLWGNYLPEFRADEMGLGSRVGRYTMAITFGGPGEGYWYRPWNADVPEDWDYIGVRFQLADGLHYGYLQYGYERNLQGLTPTYYAVLRGWAWETEPGLAILIVPEPGPGWVAAAGLRAGLLRRRRRRRGAQA